MDEQRKARRRHTLEEAELIETHGIDHIPESQRRGDPRHQFYIWFAVNMNPITIVVGALAATVGLNWLETVLVFLVANVIGVAGVGMAAALGPRLGMPQMTTSRATFGIRGNYLPAVLASLLFIGYFATTAVLGAETFKALWHVAEWPVIVGLGVVSIALTISGYDTVHRMERWLTWLAVAVFVALTICAIVNYPAHSHVALATGSHRFPALLLVFGAIFSYAVGWSAYASDYSRYLPSRTPVRKTATYTALGLCAAMIWMEVLGYAIGRLSLGDDVTHGINALAPTVVADIVFVTIVLVSIAGCVMNAYSGVMSAIAWGLPVERKTATIGFGIAGTVLAIIFSGPKFEADLEKLLFLIVYFITPWLSIVLINWALRRRTGMGFPAANAFYDRNGELGGISWDAVVAFVVGVGVSVPFMATSLYTGPLGRSLDGADISYVVSALVAAVIYIGAAHLFPTTAEAELPGHESLTTPHLADGSPAGQTSIRTTGS